MSRIALSVSVTCRALQAPSRCYISRAARAGVRLTVNGSVFTCCVMIATWCRTPGYPSRSRRSARQATTVCSNNLMGRPNMEIYLGSDDVSEKLRTIPHSSLCRLSRYRLRQRGTQPVDTPLNVLTSIVTFSRSSMAVPGYFH